jgi:hypothetical protein
MSRALTGRPRRRRVSRVRLVLALVLAVVAVGYWALTEVAGPLGLRGPLTAVGLLAGPPADPPPLPRDAVLRPQFTTTEGPVRAGSAFVVHREGGLLLLTANHLLGQAGGMSRDHTGAELDRIVQGVDLHSVDDPSATLSARHLLSLPDSEASAQTSDHDLVAFALPDAGPAHPLELADGNPSAGDTVFLLAEPYGGHGAKLVPATVEVGGAGRTLRYTFAPDAGITEPELRSTSGAPVVDAQGRVVALNCAAGADRNGGISAQGVAVVSIRQMLAGATG